MLRLGETGFERRCKFCKEFKLLNTQFRKGRAECRRCEKRIEYFGINNAEYEEYMKQKECSICDIDVVRSTRERNAGKEIAALDHCKETGKIRGVLCSNCNRGLGYFGHDISKLQKAIEYLKE